MNRPPPPDQLRYARERAGLTQQSAAAQLGVSQAYLAMMENGRRAADELGPRMAGLYRLPPTALPLGSGGIRTWNSASLAKVVANVGYPGFRHLHGGRSLNPAVLLPEAISCGDLEVRVVESLPWLAIEYHDLDWEWLVRGAELRGAQNRLGFVVTLGRRVAERSNAAAARSKPHEVEQGLEGARLAREDTLCHQLPSGAGRRGLRKKRPADALRWNPLTDLNAEALPCAA